MIIRCTIDTKNIKRSDWEVEYTDEEVEGMTEYQKEMYIHRKVKEAIYYIIR